MTKTVFSYKDKIILELTPAANGEEIEATLGLLAFENDIDNPLDIKVKELITSESDQTSPVGM